MASHWSDAAYEAVAAVVAQGTGLVFQPANVAKVERAIREAMQRAEVADFEAYVKQLAADRSALDDLVIELTVGETYFFREPDHFEFVRSVIVPDVLRRRGPHHVIRAWSAGCSTGEEAYSLAIALDETQVPRPPFILATDISRTALRSARAATYRPWSFRGVSQGVLERHFRHVPDLTYGRRSDQYVLDARFRDRVRFDYLNFAADPYPSLDTHTWGMDIIFCRNVLIYFDAQTIARVAARLRRCLAVGGWLIPGPSDPPLSQYTELEPVATRWGVFYRRSEAGKRFSIGIELNEAAPPARPFPFDVAAVPTEVTPPARQQPVLAAVAPIVVAEPSLLQLAAAAMTSGDYARTAALLGDAPEDERASALLVRALANIEVAQAERACAVAVHRHPLSLELHHLHSVLLSALARHDEAIRAARRVVYLDRSSAIGHVALGGLLRGRADRTGAAQAYRNALKVLAALPADEPVPLSDGEYAGALARVVAIELELLGVARNGRMQ